jgi:hypothetical protein
MVRLAAILILAILGHGLLMAGRADAAGHGMHEEPAMSQIAVTPTVDTPVHDETCFTVQSVIESVPLQVLDGERVAPLPIDEPDGIAPSQARVASPHHPPDTVRALLQIYRI